MVGALNAREKREQHPDADGFEADRRSENHELRVPR
jgi:hypothetical protein